MSTRIRAAGWTISRSYSGAQVRFWELVKYKDDAEKETHLHDGGAVVGNSLLAILVNHQEVTSVGAQRGLYRGLHSETGIDVGDNLTLALRSIGSCAGERPG